jgi:hypothetical protein
MRTENADTEKQLPHTARIGRGVGDSGGQLWNKQTKRGSGDQQSRTGGGGQQKQDEKT